MTKADLAADDWRLQTLQTGKAPTQAFAERLKSMGYAGLRVQSFAKGASRDDLNLILWAWGPELPMRVRLVDDEGRLT